MYVCKKCNQEIEKPKAFLWRKYCPGGHRLLGDAVVRSFWGAFARTCGLALLLSYWFLFAFAFNPDFVGGPAEHKRYLESVRVGIGGVAALIVLLNGVRALRDSRAWEKRGGAVRRLVPRERGKGFGYLAAAGLLAITAWPGF